jgi:hypothetical protein
MPTGHGFDKYFGVPYSVDMGKSAWSEHGEFPPLPLVHNTDVMEQPVDLNTLSQRYASFADAFIRNASSAGTPWLLYLAVRARIRALAHSRHSLVRSLNLPATSPRTRALGCSAHRFGCKVHQHCCNPHQHGRDRSPIRPRALTITSQWNHVHTPDFASKAFCGTTSRGLFGDALAELDWAVGQVLLFVVVGMVHC